ncbi:hypothetical protein L1987_23250 [Smallanthus sonchifolius]|uniref:Uncharacterized protein n=1 Tax=Smallanthus sonchifolius TaxID=185202 RepID=A0ACB9IGF0_9ASTR|nr:hypothetical protein L1987_23250 [Smallanthus sonchifolius]
MGLPQQKTTWLIQDLDRGADMEEPPSTFMEPSEEYTSEEDTRASAEKGFRSKRGEVPTSPLAFERHLSYDDSPSDSHREEVDGATWQEVGITYPCWRQRDSATEEDGKVLMEPSEEYTSEEYTRAHAEKVFRRKRGEIPTSPLAFKRHVSYDDFPVPTPPTTIEP